MNEADVADPPEMLPVEVKIAGPVHTGVADGPYKLNVTVPVGAAVNPVNVATS